MGVELGKMSAVPDKTDVAIIGGGFAGLSAGLCLQQAGLSVQLVEKRPFLGGRAYSFREPKTGDTVDNGQHLLMGAYHETFEFLRALGTFEKLNFQNQLSVSYAFKERALAKLTCPNWPAPLHLGMGLLNFDALNLKDKWGMARLIRFCQQQSKKNNGHAPLDRLSLSELLKTTKQSEAAAKIFWEPLVLATLNEPLEQASSEMFFNVLRLGLLSNRQDSRLVFPQVGFDELYTQPAQAKLEQQNALLHFQTQVKSIERVSAGDPSHWQIITDQGKKLTSDRLLLAVPPDALTKLLASSPSLLEELKSHLPKFRPAPILSINLWFEDFIPPQNFVGLLESPLHWVFDKAKILNGTNSQGTNRYLSVVVSGAYELTQKNKAELIELALQELQQFYPELREKKLLHSQVIKEHAATFSGRVGLKQYRPQQRTNQPGLYLAGDWTATDLPATIESAVKSGHLAADVLLEDG